LEKLHHLETLPALGFMVACFPVKITAASAGWTRAVAIINHNEVTFLAQGKASLSYACREER
jgi:hypothetical protein